MKKEFFYFFIGLIGFYGNLFGQTLSQKEREQIDSLSNIISSENSNRLVIAESYLHLFQKLKTIYPDTIILGFEKVVSIIENLPKEQREKDESKTILGKTYYLVGLRHYNKDNIANSLKYLNLAKDIFEEIGINQSLANCYYGLGLVNAKQSNYSEALAFYHQSLRINMLLSNKKDVSGLYGCIAIIHEETGNHEESKKFHFLSLKMDEELADSSGMANCFFNIANGFSREGKYEKSIEYYLRSLELSQRIGQEYLAIHCLGGLGTVYLVQCNLKKARHYFEKVIYLAKEYNIPEVQISYIFSNLGKVYDDEGNLEKAMEYFCKSIEISENYGIKYGIPTKLMNIGTIYWKVGQINLAIECFNESLKLSNEINSKYDIALSQYFIGLMYLQKDSLIESKKYFFNGYKTSFENNFYIPLGNNLVALSNQYIIEGKLDSANFYLTALTEMRKQELKSNYFSLPEADKEIYLESITTDFGRLSSFLFLTDTIFSTLSNQAYQGVISTKNLTLKSTNLLRLSIYESSDSTGILNYNHYLGNKSALSAGNFSLNERDSIIQVTNALEEKISRNCSDFASVRELMNMDLKRLKDVLSKGEVAIEFVEIQKRDYYRDTILDQEFMALLLFPEFQNVRVIKLCSLNELKKFLNIEMISTVNSVNHAYGTFLNSNSFFYDLLWKKIDKELTGIHTIYFAPSGLLHKINFAALRDENGKYLGEKYALHQLNSTAEIVTRKKIELQKDEPILVMGGIEYSNKNKERKVWSYLEGTKKESENIVSTMTKQGRTVKTYTGLLATEETFKKEAPTCGIIHLSTHGFFFPDPEEMRKERGSDWQKAGPEFASIRGAKIYADWSFVNNKNPLMRSGLVLAGANDVWDRETNEEGEDGVLTASEISNLNLSKAKLVVLSACETGLGDIKGSEGVYGLQRGLKMAGAKNLIMSLWKVPDEETGIFMTDFYNRLSEGKEISIAFRETQAMMQKKYDPYYWAAFVLVE